MDEFSQTLDGFEQNEFGHLTVVHAPSDDDEPEIEEAKPEISAEIEETPACDDVVEIEPIISEEPAAESIECPSRETSPAVESGDSTISSMVPHCGSETEIFLKREREIEDIIPRDTIQLPGSDCAQMFEQFEELESVEEPAAPVGVAILDDKVFRFAVYDKIQTPVKSSSESVSGTGSSTSGDESSDEVDIPINSTNQNEEIIIADVQVENALIAAEDDEYDISLEEMPSGEASATSSSTSSPDDDQNDEPVERNETLEFEYENVEKPNGEVVNAPVVTAPAEEIVVAPPAQVVQPPPPVTPAKTGWESEDDREKETAPNADITFIPNSGDIRERGVIDTRTNEEIRSDMEKEKNAYRPPPRRSGGPQQNNQTPGRDRNIKSDEWDVTTVSENRTRDTGRDFNSSNRDHFERNRNNDRRFDNRRSDGNSGYGGGGQNRDFQNSQSYRDNNRRPYNNDNVETWSGAGGRNEPRDNRNERRSHGGDGGGAGSRENWQSCGAGRSGSYNQGTPRRTSYNSDNSDGPPRDNSRNNNFRPENGHYNRERQPEFRNQPPIFDNYGNRQRSNEQRNRGGPVQNSDEYQQQRRSGGHQHGPIGPNNNNRDQVLRKPFQNRSFQSDHCNRDDFNGQTKQINDESFGGMRSERSGKTTTAPTEELEMNAAAMHQQWQINNSNY